jgi:hypothetical protein
MAADQVIYLRGRVGWSWGALRPGQKGLKRRRESVELLRDVMSDLFFLTRRKSVDLIRPD